MGQAASGVYQLRSRRMIKKIDEAIKSLEDLEFDKDFRKLIDIDRDDYMSKFDLKFVSVLSYLKEIKRNIRKGYN